MISYSVRLKLRPGHVQITAISKEKILILNSENTLIVKIGDWFIDVRNYDSEECKMEFNFELNDKLTLVSCKKIKDGVEYSCNCVHGYNCVSEKSGEKFFRFRKFFCAREDDIDDISIDIEKIRED